MRYVIIFTDRTSKHVSEEHAAVFRRCLFERIPVEYKGAVYSWTAIAKILPIHAHEQDLREETAQAGLYRCPYGRAHLNRSECSCKDAGYERILNAEEERHLLEEGGSQKSLRPSTAAQDAKTLGFTDKKLLNEAPSWKKAGSVLSSPPAGGSAAGAAS